MEKQEKEPSEAAFDDVKWENVVVNGSEQLIHGKNGKTLKSKDLRRILQSPQDSRGKECHKRNYDTKDY